MVKFRQHANKIAAVIEKELGQIEFRSQNPEKKVLYIL